MTGKDRVRQAYNIQSARSAAKYYGCYDNTTYIKATAGKSVRYANALTSDALALCGHPGYKVSHRHWCKDALEHLGRFI